MKGSRFDGYFENVAERIKAVLTPEKRRTVLELKYLTPDNTTGTISSRSSKGVRLRLTRRLKR
jgi:hypothetical protein